MKKVIIRFGVVFGILIFALILFNSITYTTYQDEYKVVRQFGEVKKISSKPGISFKVPLIQSVSSIPNNLQYYNLPVSDIITSDKKTMIIDAYVTWKIVDAKKFIQSLNANISSAEGRIDVITYNAIKTTVSKMTQDELVASRNTDVHISTNTSLEFEDIEINDLESTDNPKDEVVESKDLSKLILDAIGTNCDEYGISIEKVNIKKLDLPNENKNAVYTRMMTERENIAAAYTAQGNSEAQIIKNQTDKEVSIILSEADATAKVLIAEGEAEYMNILSDAYNDSGKANFYQFVRALEAAKKSLKGDNNTLILSKDSPLVQIFNGNY